MIKKAKIIVRKVIFLPLHLFNKLSQLYVALIGFIDPNGSECYWEELSQKQIDSRTGSNLKFKHQEYKPNNFNSVKKLKFYTPTKIASLRTYTLFSKEKDTLKWIEKYGDKNKTFFDVGANMGVYSLFYALTYKSKVYSFEPSFRNLDLLVRNIKLNNLKQFISVISNPIYNSQIISNFSQSKNIAGLAEATFGKDIDGNRNDYNTLGISLDYLVESNVIEKPNLIKIDVDGNEVEVLKGARNIVKSENCNSILIETRPDTNQPVKKILEESGYKRIFDLDNNERTKIDEGNQIWLRG